MKRRTQRPDIYVEMCVCFNDDFDVYLLDDILGIKCDTCKKRNEMGKSVLDGKQLEGFWLLKSKTYSDWDAKRAIDEIWEQIKDKADIIRRECILHKGFVVFDIVPTFKAKNLPAIYFEPYFLETVCFLKATIQLDMYLK